MFFLVFILCASVTQVICLNFEVKNVTRFSLERNNTYFGYSVHLQRGSVPMVIVGAPKADPKLGGAVYSCTMDNKCTKYLDLTTYNGFTFTSNFLGSSLDGSDITGEEIIVCSPRKVLLGSSSGNTFQKGLCFYHKNTTKFTSDQPILINPLEQESFVDGSSRQPYYNYAFAQAGFDVHYLKNENKVLLGAPGVKTWSGSVIVQSLRNVNDYTILPVRSAPRLEEIHGYMGYTVSSGVFNKFQTSSQITVGGPRANKLDGLVQIFNGQQPAVSFTSDETGSYYGAAVLVVDINNDGMDELFVGAPFGSGRSYDEGYVYYYKNFTKQYKLLGSQKTAARFGSSMVNLGDIDYDSYKDIAIAAPNEDDGVGAVYIYMGGKNGIQQIFSQRLSPLTFNGGSGVTKGFGSGLSRGNDLDANGHNDLAVGAYRSGEVFLFYGLSIIDYKVSLQTNVSSLSGSGMKVSYCLYYSQRSPTQDQKTVDFKIMLTLDYRTKGRTHFDEKRTLVLKTAFCQTWEASITQSEVDIMPYKLSLKAEVLSNVVAKGESLVEKSIPFVHGCGDDNICQTKVTIFLEQNKDNIIIAKDTEVTIEVNAKNSGETGYQCQLIIETPDDTELSQNSLCTFENETYVCPFASRLIGSEQAVYKFDVSGISSTREKIVINFKIKCLGVNLANGTAVASFAVSLQNSPYIEGKSDPEKIYFQRSQPESFEVTHLYSVGNSGPSPVKLDITFLLPVVQYQDKNIFEFSKVTLNGFQHNCFSSSETARSQRSFDIETLIKQPLNGTAVYDSFTDGLKNLKLYCTGDYLKKSSQIARYEVTFKVDTQLIADMYQNEILKDNVVAYITSAYLYSSSQKVEGRTVTLVQSTKEKTTLLWIYIVVGVILGIILLALLIFLLYRCHFFDRKLRDKMNDENLMNEENEANNVETEVELTNPDDSDLNTEENTDVDVKTEIEGSLGPEKKNA